LSMFGMLDTVKQDVRSDKMIVAAQNAKPGGVDVAVPGHALPLLREEVSRGGGDLPTLAR
jgi:hypothetical protein